MRDVLILGGYGNFGKRVALALARHGVPIIVAGRNAAKAASLATEVRSLLPDAKVRAAVVDAERDLESYLIAAQPAAVVNTCGPFQDKDYRVAQSCVRQKIHYVDLADGRDFVTGITCLDAAAKAADVCVISGASTVPGLSSAVVEHYKREFAKIEELIFGISPGQKADRGLATTQGILSYVGKRLRPAAGGATPRYGWQDMYRQKYPGLGSRWMANCDIPDLDLLPQRYDIKRIYFSAGMENGLLHLALFALSWLVRFGLPLHLDKHAAFLLRASHWFDVFGTDAGGMHVILRGTDHRGQHHERKWFIIARNGDGPQIPCVPAILLAKRLVEGGSVPRGAYPCIGLISLKDYLQELGQYAIETIES